MRKIIALLALLTTGSALAQTWVDASGMMYPRQADSQWAPAYAASYTIDAAGEKVAQVFPVWHTGNVAKIGVTVWPVTTSATLKLSLQNVDSATGDPDGTILQSCTVTPVAYTDVDCTLGSTQAVTAGSMMAVVAEFDSTVGNLKIAGQANITYGGNLLLSYVDQYTTSWGKKTAAVAAAYLEYDDGVHYQGGLLPSADWGYKTYNSGNSPDEYGAKLTIPFHCKVGGIWVKGNWTGAATLELYDSSSTELAYCSLDPDIRGYTTNKAGAVCRFSSDVELAKDAVYYISLKPTTTSNVYLARTQVPLSSYLAQFSGGSTFYQVSRTDNGSWTEDNTHRPALALIISQIDVGSSSSGGGTRSYSIQ